MKFISYSCNSKFYFVFFIINIFILYSCTSKKNNREGIVEQITYPQTQLPTLNEEAVKVTDSVYLRFFSEFENNKVIVLIQNSDFIMNLDSVTTDKSLASANIALPIPKNKGKFLLIQIDSFDYKIKIPNKFAYIDIYYDKSKRKISVAFTNAILILS
ncbi:MAG: hypothetical protein QM687_14400 [Ferruginibacter sp.]